MFEKQSSAAYRKFAAMSIVALQNLCYTPNQMNINANDVMKVKNFLLWSFCAAFFIFVPQQMLAKQNKTTEAADRSLVVMVEDKEGNPIANAQVSGWGGEDFGSGTTDADGEVTMTVSSDNTSKWSLSVTPPAGYTFGFAYDIAVNTSGETVVKIMVSKADATIVATLKDAQGNIVTLTNEEYAWVNCFIPGKFDNFFSGNIQGSQSSVSMSVTAGSYECDANVNGKGATGGSVTVASGGTANLTITVLEYDSTIHVVYVDQDGNTLTDITSFQVFGNTTKDPDGNETFGNFIHAEGTNGEATLDALSGYTYQIGANIMGGEGFSGGGEAGTYEGEEGEEGDHAGSEEGKDSGEGSSGSETECPKEMTQEECDAMSKGGEEGKDSGEGSSGGGSSGETECPKEATKEQCDQYSKGGGGQKGYTSTGVHITSSGTTYLQNYKMIEVVPVAGEESLVEIEVEVADATINVSLLDADGEAVSSGFVMVSKGDLEKNFDQGKGEHSWDGFVGGPLRNGSASLSVASDTTYEVSAFPEGAKDGSVLPPPKTAVTLKSGETRTLVLQATASDWTLKINASVEGDVELEQTFCYAYAPSLGIRNFDQPFDEDVAIEVTRDDVWYVGCMGYGNETFYRSVDQSTTPSGKKDGTSTVDVSLIEGGEYFGQTSYAINPAVQTTITLPDETSTLILPADFVTDSGGGNVTLTVETDTEISVDDDNFPVQAYAFTLTDSTGEQITDFDQNATFKATYDPDLALEQFDLDELSFDGGSYDDGIWQSPVSTKLDSDNDQVVITLDHFSTYAVVADRGLSTVSEGEDELSLPSAPAKLKAKKLTSTGAVLTWGKVKGAHVKSYMVQVRVGKSKKQKTWMTYKKITKVQRKLSALTAGTKYQFRVRATNSVGDSAWSDWKKFSTKK